MIILFVTLTTIAITLDFDSDFTLTALINNDLLLQLQSNCNEMTIVVE